MYRVNDLARVYTRIRRGLKVHAANKMRFYGVESVEFQPVAPPPLLVTPVELRIPLAKPNPSPTYPLPSARRRLYFFPLGFFFLGKENFFAPFPQRRRKNWKFGEFFGILFGHVPLDDSFLRGGGEAESRAVDGLPSAINKPRGFSVYSHGSG